MIKDSDVAKLETSLYPTGRAWDYATGTKKQPSDAEYYVDGEGAIYVDGDGNMSVSVPPVYADVNASIVTLRNSIIADMYRKIDSILDQMLPDSDLFTIDDIENFERIYGIEPAPQSTNDQRRQILYAQMTRTGAKPYQWTAEYLQDILQLNGFNVFVHENRFSGQSVQFQVGTMDIGFANVGGGHESEFPFVSLIPVAGWTEICANNIRPEHDAGMYDPVNGPTVGFLEVGNFEVADDTPAEYNNKCHIIFIGGKVLGERAYIEPTRMRQARDLILKNKELHTVAFLYIDNVLN